MPTTWLSGPTPVRFVVSLIALLLAFSGQVYACAVCLQGITITPGQKLDSATEAVLALPLPEQGQFRIIEVIKGDVAVNVTITQPGLSAANAAPVISLDGPLSGQAGSQSENDKPLLLVRDKLSEEWGNIGEIDAAYADWLRQLAATGRGGKGAPMRSLGLAALVVSDTSTVQWPERLAVVAPHIESKEPIVAEIAYGELARAPYSALQTLKTQLDATDISNWVNDQKLTSRLPVYTLLMGITGDSDEADELERRIDSALGTGDATNLSALLAADIELRGPSRIEWLEKTFFADRHRTLPQIEAALLALSVHGDANGTVSRARVVDAYCNFIRMRPPMAGFVAMELADWEAWEATADYVDIIRSKAVKDPAGEFAILSYLQESPAAAALASSQPPTDRQE